MLYLEPSPADQLRALAAALVGAAADFAPHLSVARLTDEEAGAYAREEIEARVRPLLPVDATVRTLSVHVQYDSRWWRVEHVAHLGAPPWTVRSG